MNRSDQRGRIKAVDFFLPEHAEPSISSLEKIGLVSLSNG